jgi:hypothetical protein
MISVTFYSCINYIMVKRFTISLNKPVSRLMDCFQNDYFVFKVVLL